MGWSFRESVKILPGVRLNFSRRGVSASIGAKGLHLGVGGGRAPRVSGGVGPLRYYQSLGSKHEGLRHAPARSRRRSFAGSLLAVLGLLAVLVVWILLPPRWVVHHLYAAAPHVFPAAWAERPTSAAGEGGSGRAVPPVKRTHVKSGASR